MTSVLITSIGRRGYLAEYFADIFGHDYVFVGDSDEQAPGMHAGFQALQLLGVDSPGYVDHLRATVRANGIRLVLSLHDHEVAVLSREREVIGPDCVVLGMPTEKWGIGLDKLETYRLLEKSGLSVPRTFAVEAHTANEFLRRTGFPLPVILKPRFGSASIGVSRIASLEQVADYFASQPVGEILVQEFILGDEYGLDIVSDLQGRYLGTLARRKIRMLHGETDAAVTVDAAQFRELSQALAEATGHIGPVDADVLVDAEGRQYVVDLNPRFGGGYPFSHIAGANVPRVLHGLLVQGKYDSADLQPKLDVQGRKSISVVRVSVPSS